VTSLLCLVLGLIFIADFFDTAIIITTDVIGILFVTEGTVWLFALAAIGLPNARIPVLKALGFFALGFMAIDVPWDDNIVATIVLGGALILDGPFRLAAAFVIRSVRWRQSVLMGLTELIIGGLIWVPGHYRTGTPGRFAPAWHFWRRRGAWRASVCKSVGSRLEHR
jgi:uncharacterized membrane protein HdeD (DUF308 family)